MAVGRLYVYEIYTIRVIAPVPDNTAVSVNGIRGKFLNNLPFDIGNGDIAYFFRLNSFADYQAI